MPLTGAVYEERSADEILAFLAAEMRAEFGEDIDLTESSAFRTFAEAVAGADSNDIEPALSDVHDAAFLDSAEGENLEKVVAILGLSRRSATHATGTIRFNHGGTSANEYTIQSGTVAQTTTEDPVQFETINPRTLSNFDTFDSGSLDSSYDGSTADYSVVDGSASGDPSPYQGSHMLKGPQTSGSKVFVTEGHAARGSVMDFRTYLDSGAVVANLFGVEAADSHYRTRINDSGEHAIEIVTPSGVTTLTSNTSVAVPNGEWLRNEIQWDGEEGGRIISRVYDASGNLIDQLEITGEREIDEGGFGFQSLDGSADKYWDHSGERSVIVDARAQEGGTRGNVGANTINTMPTVPSGVDSITNPFAMGDDSHRLTDTTEFTVGRPEETDEELRERAQISEGESGKATVPAIIAEISALPNAESVSVYENKTDTDNTGSGGLPPHSFEVVYYGADPNQDIADTLFDVKGATAWDYGGAHGTEVTETVLASNGQEFTMHWSEPTEVSVDMTLDVVVNDEFVGKEDVRDAIVDYVGGLNSSGRRVLGTGSGEDIYVDQIEDIVTGPDETGVIGISSYSFTPSVTTDSNGLEVVSIGSNEVAATDATDGSITINVTRV